MVDNSRDIHRHWYFLNYKTLPAPDTIDYKQIPAGVSRRGIVCTRSLLFITGKMVQIFLQAFLGKNLYSLLVFQ